MWFGIGAHIAMAAYYDPSSPRSASVGIDAFEQYCRNWLAASESPSIEDEEWVAELRDLGIGVLNTYFTFAQKNDRFDVIFVEHEYNVDIPGLPGVRYNFRVDGLVVDEHGRVWLLEHKTAASLTEGDQEWLLMDDQVGSYIWALLQTEDVQKVLADLGKDSIEGVFYNSLRKKKPQQLRVLQSGLYSAAKNQDTTFDIAYAQLCEEYGKGKVPVKYHELLRILRDKETEMGNNFVKREFVRRNQYEIRKIGEFMREEVLDMINNPTIYRSPSRINCSGCPFVGPCLSKWEGGDYKFIIENNYRVRGPRV